MLMGHPRAVEELGSYLTGMFECSNCKKLHLKAYKDCAWSVDKDNHVLPLCNKCRQFCMPKLCYLLV